MKISELSPLEIGKWYAVAVGEIGISPADFYKMTEEELAWAYEGYKQRQEDLANILLLAINRANSSTKDELFDFVEKKGYDIGTLEDRYTTFQALGITGG